MVNIKLYRSQRNSPICFLLALCLRGKIVNLVRTKQICKSEKKVIRVFSVSIYLHSLISS